MLFYIKYKINDTNNFKYESNELLKLNNKYVKFNQKYCLYRLGHYVIGYVSIVEYQLYIAAVFV